MTRFQPTSIALVVLLIGVPPDGASARRQGEVRSSDGVSFTLSGGIHARASYGRSDTGPDVADRLGFGLRRARFKVAASLPSGAGLYLQLDGSDGQVSALDFYASYQLNPTWRFRLGRFASAQPRGLILTGMNQIDVADRAAVAERWGRMTIGADGRDFGVDARYRSGGTEVLIDLHNGDGNWDRARGNFRTVISSGSATQGAQRTGLAASAAVSRDLGTQGLEVGGFAGLNTSRNPNTERGGIGRSYTTFGAHAYLGAQPGSRPVRIKLDLLAINFESYDCACPTSVEYAAQRALGASILAATRLAAGTEVMVRGEWFDADPDDAASADQYLTLAVAFSPSARRGQAFHRERVTLAWQRRLDGGYVAGSENLVFIQLQFGL